MTKYIVDGSRALADQENDLNGVEQLTLRTTTAYAKHTGAPAGTAKNQASMDDATAAFHPLYLAFLDVGASTAAVIAQQLSAGRNLVFTGTAYVAGAEKTVMGFRQP